MVKKEYYGNEGFGLAWDHIKLSQMDAFITNDSLKNKFKSEAHAIQSGDIGSLKTVIIKILNTVAPFKKRIVRGNNKPHIAEKGFTEKSSQYDQNITLIEKKCSISEKHKIANIFNKYFVNVTKTLNISEWKPQKGLTFQNLDIILDTFSSHPSVIQIKEKINNLLTYLAKQDVI